MAVRVFDRREMRTTPSTPRAPMTEISRSRSTNASRTASLAPERAPRRRQRVSRRRESAPALCRRSRSVAVLSTAGSRPARRPRRRSASVRTGANGVTGSPCSARNVFSRMRCCAIVERAPVGRTIACSSAAAAAAAGTFSNSNVTTSTPLANARTCVEIVVRAHRSPRRRSGRWACRARARACGRDSRGGARPSRTCARAGRRRARRSSRREGSAAEDRDRDLDASRQRAAADLGGDLVAIRLQLRRGAPGATWPGSRRRAGRRSRRPPAPIATVATGTPFGICTIDSSESSPFSAALCTGTPITGRTVCAATMPGQVRGAAGAGDDHLEPAARPPSRRTRPSSAACGARTRPGTRAARRTASRISSACRIVSQSDLLPMMTPTSGRGSACGIFHHE